MLVSTLRAFTVLGALLIAAGVAAADDVVYGVNNSVIHKATRSAVTKPDGNTYYMGGRILYDISGHINASRNVGDGTITFTGGHIEADSRGYTGSKLGFNTTKDIDIFVTGGSFERQGNGRPQGFLHTRWEQTGATTTNVTLYFAPYYFSGAMNTQSSDLLDFMVWGNNTYDMANGSPASYSNRIGMDLMASGTPSGGGVPEPAFALLAAAGAFVAIRRRRRAARAA